MKKSYLLILQMFISAIIGEETNPPALLGPHQICKSNAWGFAAFGEYLYWKSEQDDFNLGYVQTLSEHYPNVTDTDETNIPTKFPYEPGFRLGFRVLTPWDFGAFTFSWTQFNNHTSKYVSFPPEFTFLLPFIVVVPNIPNSGFSYIADVKWKIHYRDFEMHWSRSMLLTNHFSVSPKFGARFSQIYEVMKGIYVPLSMIERLYDAKILSKFQGWGAELGADSSWILGYGFEIVTDLALTLYWTTIRYFDSNTIFYIDPPFDQYNILNGKTRQIRPKLDLSIGLKWNWCLANRCTLSLAGLYELNYFWNSFVRQHAVSSPLSWHDLSIQGFSVSAGLQF